MTSRPKAWVFIKGWAFRQISGRALFSFAALAIYFFALAGCATGHPQIENVPLSFNAVKTVVVKSLPGGTRLESDNGRTMTSSYFDPTTLKPEDFKKPLGIRAFCTVAIFGSSRPYAIEVKAFKEKKEKDGYTDLGEDLDLTDRLAERLRTSLADRREDRNVIDDFRVF